MSRLMLTALIVIATPLAAHAQRNGEVYGGQNHQPTQNEVDNRQAQSRIAPPPARQQAETRDVETLRRHLLTQPTPPAGAIPPGPPGH